MKFQILKSNSSTQPYFWRIVAANGQVLAFSETYTSVAGCRNAIDTVKAGAATAPVEEFTKPAASRAW